MNAAVLAHFASGLPVHRARKVLAVALRCAEAESDPHAETLQRAAAAWESDLQPVRSAIAAALHAGSRQGILSLRRLLPGLLRELNRASGFETALGRAMLTAFREGFDERPVAGAELRIAETTTETDGLRQLRQREVFETDLGSAELRSFSQGLRNRSIFSARCTNAEFLEEVKGVCDDILSGKINQATGRLRLLGKLKELGYDPAIGFPGDMADIPPAERGSLQDLSSTRRLDLIIETNVRMAQNYGRMIAGNQPYELREYPAWELKRLFYREIPRGKKQVHGVIVDDPGNAWRQRWSAAGESVLWEGAKEAELIARKDSPIWQALGDGSGGFTDTLLNPFPPFAFRSGMGWAAVARAQCVQLGLVAADEVPAPMAGTLTPKPAEKEQVTKKLSPELKAELLRELEALGV